MAVLVACEESQAVCCAFRSFGIEAFSCDLLECSGGHPEWHIQGSVLGLLYPPCSFVTCDGVSHFVLSWDIVIAFPPCTYMTKAGATLMYPRGVLSSSRLDKALAAKSFFMKFYELPGRVAIENPVPLKIVGLPPCDQIVQPYYFGEHYSKKTCLWLHNLPLLMATDIVSDFVPYINGPNNKYRDSRRRSKTFPAVAAAMASQWRCYV